LEKNHTEEELNDEEELDNQVSSDILEAKFDKKLDDLVKKQIDNKRVKKIDQTKKRATVDSVFDERMYLQVRKLLKSGILNRIEGIISAGKEAR